MRISLLTALALGMIALSLPACSGKHESQGKKVGKQMDDLKQSAQDQLEEGKETFQNKKEQVEKKATDIHQQAKDKAHEIIDES